MKKKVAVIIERADIVLGGAERSVFELAMALSASSVKVDILAAKGQTNAKNIHILCKDHPGRRASFFRFGKTLKKYLSANHYDIIHSVLPFLFADVYQPRGGAYAEAIRRNAASYQDKIKTFYKKTTAFANLRRTTLLLAEKRLCKSSTGPVIAALSQYVAEQFRQHYKLSDNRIAIIPNAVRLNKRIDKRETDKLRTQILTKLGLTEADRPVFFLFVANNFRLKGLRPLLEAMQIAAKTNASKPAYLIVAGRDKANAYRAYAKKLKIHKKLIFLGPVRHIQNILAITDVGILPTFYDPSSRFILEALAANRPVITTRFNGAAELFTNDRHGKIIDKPENTSALAEAINYFSDTENINSASQAIATNDIAAKIAITRAAKQLTQLYETILSRRQ